MCTDTPPCKIPAVPPPCKMHMDTRPTSSVCAWRVLQGGVPEPEQVDGLVKEMAEIKSLLKSLSK